MGGIMNDFITRNIDPLYEYFRSFAVNFPSLLPHQPDFGFSLFTFFTPWPTAPLYTGGRSQQRKGDSFLSAS